MHANRISGGSRPWPVIRRPGAWWVALWRAGAVAIALFVLLAVVGLGLPDGDLVPLRWTALALGVALVVPGGVTIWRGAPRPRVLPSVGRYADLDARTFRAARRALLGGAPLPAEQRRAAAVVVASNSRGPLANGVLLAVSGYQLVNFAVNNSLPAWLRIFGFVAFPAGAVAAILAMVQSARLCRAAAAAEVAPTVEDRHP